jgi:acetyl esterase/lipase
MYKKTVLSILLLLNITLCFSQDISVTNGFIDGENYKDGVVYKTVDGSDLVMDIFYPDAEKMKEKNAWVVFIHGGGWAGGHRDNIYKTAFLGSMQKLVEQGVVVATVQYRLAKSPVTSYESVVDCKDAARFLIKNALDHQLDEDNYAIWGGSAGGHLSLVTALVPDALFPGDASLSTISPEYKAAVAFYPFTSCLNEDLRPNSIFEDGTLFDRLLGGAVADNQELALHLSPTEYLNASSTPIYLVHGEVDGTLPVINSTYMKSVADTNGAEAELLVVENADHSFGGSNISTSLDDIAINTANFILSRVGYDTIVDDEEEVSEDPLVGDVFVDADNLKYTVTSLEPNEAEVYGFDDPENNAIASVVIPTTATDTRTSITYRITAIGQAAFSGSSNSKRSNAGYAGNHVITSVTLPSSVSHLKIHAFRDLPNLATINLEDVVSTEDSIFATDPLLSDIGSLTSMETFGNYAIFGCGSLTSINVGSSLTSIGSFFIADSGITDVYYNWNETELSAVTMTLGNYLRNTDASTVTLHIPVGTTEVYMSSPFYIDGMTILDDIVFEAPAIGDVFVAKDKLKYTVTSLDPNEAEVYGFEYPLTDAIANVVIPESAKDTRTSTTYSITGIGQAAFSGSSNSKRSNAGYAGNHVITSVTLPSSVSHLKIHAFRDLPNLATINLDDVVSTENSIFATMPLLSDVGSLASMEILGNYAVFGCIALKNINVGASLTTIGSNFLSGSITLTDIYYNWTSDELATVTFNSGGYLGDVDASTVTLHIPVGTTEAYMSSPFYIDGMTILDDVLLSTGAVARELGFKIYPNPVKDVLTLENNKLELTKVTIIDMKGKVVLATQANGVTNSIDLSGLTSGVYVLRINTDTYTFEERIIKQ